MISGWNPRLGEENYLTIREWNPADLGVTICLEVPSHHESSRHQHKRWLWQWSSWMRGTLKKNGRMSTKMALQMKTSEMVEVVCMYEHQQDRRTPSQMLLEGCAPTLKLWSSHSRLQLHTLQRGSLTRLLCWLTPRPLLSHSPQMLQIRQSEDSKKTCGDYHTSALHAVLQWIPAHCGIPGNDCADHVAKSGSKKLQPPSTSTYQEAKDPAPKQTEDRVEESRWGLQTQPTIPSTSSRDATRPQSWGCEQTTVDYEPTWSALVSLTLLTATARQHNKQFTIWSRNVPCVTCREDRLGHRSCGEQRKICVAPSTSWQHLISESDTGDRMQKKKKTSNKTVKTHPPRVVHPKCQLSDWHESSCSHMP